MGNLSIKHSSGGKATSVVCVSYFTQEGDESGEQTNGHNCCGMSPHPREREAGSNGLKHKFRTFGAMKKEGHAVTAYRDDKPVGSLRKGHGG